MNSIQLQEIVSLFLMAAALGMDAFSVSLGMGMQALRLKRIALIGLVIGLFHIVMPFIGIVLGTYLSARFDDWAELLGGLLLVGIGAQMFFSAFRQDEDRTAFQPVGFGLMLFAFTVSLDSFSVGLSLGMSKAKTLLVIGMFGVTSMLLTWTGLFLGRKVRGFLGAYSEILGGSILSAFGLYFIFG